MWHGEKMEYIPIYWRIVINHHQPMHGDLSRKPAGIIQADWETATAIVEVTCPPLFIIKLLEVKSMIISYPICCMVLVYLPTVKGDFFRVNVGNYSSTMEQMGYDMRSSWYYRLQPWKELDCKVPTPLSIYVQAYIHYTPLHFTTLHYITLHYITLHYMILQSCVLYYITS